MSRFKTIAPQDRPTFKVAFLYRSHGLISRETFIAFQKTYDEIVNCIVTCQDEDELWKFVRSMFNFDDYADTVPINAANLSITFDAVQRLMNAMALDWNRDISIQKRIQPFVYTIQAARALVAKQLNVEPKLIAFMRNGSDPNAVINNGMDFEPGDEVVVWNENHPTNGDVAWKIRKARFPNINIVIVDLDGETNEEKIIHKFVSKVNKSTRIVAFSEIMDNLLIQVTGRKRVVLYSPKDATKLYLNGDKSEVLDIDRPDLTKYPKFAEATPFECFLEPGDVLFIPAMWFHNVISLQFGVAVNVFWRHLDMGFYDGKDTYGNKDLVPAARAMQIMDRAIKALEELPEEYKDFYARRVVCKIKDRCFSREDRNSSNGVNGDSTEDE